MHHSRDGSYSDIFSPNGTVEPNDVQALIVGSGVGNSVGIES